jgi:4'-phosphopantetheinyl transferase
MRDSLSDNDVHVWRALWPLRAIGLSDAWNILTEDERSRAKRFRFRLDQQRFVVCRALLRWILSLYVDVKAHDLRFCYNAWGKPDLAQDEPTVSFSLSHCDDLSVYAVRSCGAVGIDIERIRLDFPYEPIADRFFSRRENAELVALPRSRRAAAFFTWWTRKEAYVKAQGHGLSLPLDEIDVSATSEHDVAAIPLAGSLWWMRECRLRSGYVGTVAGNGVAGNVTYWEWSGAGNLAWSDVEHGRQEVGQ